MSTTQPSDVAATTELPSERCGQCGVPAAHDQRYCLNCGFHRRNAPDPVSRYLSEASAARARVAAAAALAAQRRRTPRLGLRLVALLVAGALLVGVLIGNAIGGGSAPASTSRGGGGGGHSSVSAHARAKGTTKLKNATGSSYLQQEQNLPNSVTP